MPTANLMAMAAPTAGAPTVDFSGKWKNQLNSEMDLVITGQKVTGRYKSLVSSGGSTVEGEITGYVDRDLIAIVVNWDTTASLTSWTGQMVDEGGTETIETLWHLVMDIAEGPAEGAAIWQSTFAGADTFARP